MFWRLSAPPDDSLSEWRNIRSGQPSPIYWPHRPHAFPGIGTHVCVRWRADCGGSLRDHLRRACQPFGEPPQRVAPSPRFLDHWGRWTPRCDTAGRFCWRYSRHVGITWLLLHSCGPDWLALQQTHRTERLVDDSEHRGNGRAGFATGKSRSPRSTSRL